MTTTDTPSPGATDGEDAGGNTGTTGGGNLSPANYVFDAIGLPDLIGAAQKGPGILMQVVGALLVLLAGGFRFNWFGSSTTLNNNEFASVFFGGIALIVVGTVFALVRERMAADEGLQKQRLAFTQMIEEQKQQFQYDIDKRQLGADAATAVLQALVEGQPPVEPKRLALPPGTGNGAGAPSPTIPPVDIEALKPAKKSRRPWSLRR